MAHSVSPATPGAPRAAAGGGVRMVRVPDDRAGQRLDHFLLGQLQGAPKSLVYKIVRSGQVRVNGGRAKADTRLAGGADGRTAWRARVWQTGLHLVGCGDIKKTNIT